MAEIPRPSSWRAFHPLSPTSGNPCPLSSMQTEPGTSRTNPSRTSTRPSVLELGRLEAIGHGLKMELLRLKFFELKGEKAPKALFASGSQNDDFFKREEVTAYLKEIEEKAMCDFGKGFISTGPMFGKSDGPKFLPGTFDFSRNLDSSGGEKLSFMGDLDAALINSSPDEDMAILDQLLELQQGENDYQKDQANTESAINEVDEELDEQEKLLGKLRGR